MSAIQQAADASFERPATLQSSKSFSRMESSPKELPSRSRARTLQAGTISKNLPPTKMDRVINQDEGNRREDIFDEAGANSTSQEISTLSLQDVPDGFDDLPIELVSLTDRFISSLTAKVHASPPSADKLSDLFQDFYTRAESHISIHISTLSSRLNRNRSPATSVSSRSSSTFKGAARLQRQVSKDTLSSFDSHIPEQQMLTPREVAERRKERRLLAQKGTALEEAVERRICETLYDRIWRHKSSLDEVRDEKLRSKTAALALVGIGLKDLGITVEPLGKSEMFNDTASDPIDAWISEARERLLKMNEAHYAAGKIHHLSEAYKSIVDLLTHLHQSSSSADEILPTLIYTLITTPPEGINVISNLQFISRFRAASKIDGEAAYLLTTLDAAITFLETVDLASLREDEAIEGPPKSQSRPSTPHFEPSDPLGAISITPSTASNSSGMSGKYTADLSIPHASQRSSSSQSLSKTPPLSSPSHQRRLSSLFQPPASAIGAASDAVRTTADQGFKSISNSLDNSFKLLFGKLKDQNIQSDGNDVNRSVVVPRTLDEARKLVDPKPDVDEDEHVSGASSVTDQVDRQIDNHNEKSEDRIMNLIGGQRKQNRERSADSARSTGSGKRVAFVAEVNDTREQAEILPALIKTSGTSATPAAPAQAPNGAVESMRSLGSTLNPLNRLAGMNMMRGFGKTPPNAQPITSTLPATHPAVAQAKEPQNMESRSSYHGAATSMAPAIPRFLTADVGDLKIGEISELLEDYRRLAGALKNAGIIS